MDCESDQGNSVLGPRNSNPSFLYKCSVFPPFNIRALVGFGARDAIVVTMTNAKPLARSISLLSPDGLKFEEVVPGVSKAMLQGNPEKGAYVAFTKFAPGIQNPLHTHTNEVRMLVISGAYIYTIDGKEHRAGPHSYVVIPAGVEHMSAGDPKEGALFLEEGDQKFDINWMDQELQETG